jgi:hypothetical protein
MTPCTLTLLCLATTAPERITLHPAPTGAARLWYVGG